MSSTGTYSVFPEVSEEKFEPYDIEKMLYTPHNSSKPKKKKEKKKRDRTLDFLLEGKKKRKKKSKKGKKRCEENPPRWVQGIVKDVTIKIASTASEIAIMRAEAKYFPDGRGDKRR